jgi:two-component system, LuxR family, sensor kinase FixL
MGEMASALAHELNQPLSAVANYLQGSKRLLQNSPDPRAQMIMEALDKASEQAVRAGQVIHRLRDFVARGETEKRIESIKKLVEEASALALVRSARRDGVSLQSDNGDSAAIGAGTTHLPSGCWLDCIRPDERDG